MPDSESNLQIKRRLDDLTTKQQRAGLTPEEKLELVALRDSLMTRAGGSNESQPQTVDPAQVRARRSGREMAEVWAEQMRGALGVMDDRQKDSFIRTIRELLPELIPATVAQDTPMSLTEAVDWEAKTGMPAWSKNFAHQPIERIPVAYLEAVAGYREDDEFKKQLRRYLASTIRNVTTEAEDE